jgi:hypothetical protein
MISMFPSQQLSVCFFFHFRFRQEHPVPVPQQQQYGVSIVAPADVKIFDSTEDPVHYGNDDVIPALAVASEPDVPGSYIQPPITAINAFLPTPSNNISYFIPSEYQSNPLWELPLHRLIERIKKEFALQSLTNASQVIERAYLELQMTPTHLYKLDAVKILVSLGITEVDFA